MTYHSQPVSANNSLLQKYTADNFIKLVQGPSGWEKLDATSPSPPTPLLLSSGGKTFGSQLSKVFPLIDKN